jgi:hypothetical protein
MKMSGSEVRPLSRTSSAWKIWVKGMRSTASLIVGLRFSNSAISGSTCWSGHPIQTTLSVVCCARATCGMAATKPDASPALTR